MKKELENNITMKNKIEIFKKWGDYKNGFYFAIYINGSFADLFFSEDEAKAYATKIATKEEIKPELIFTLEY